MTILKRLVKIPLLPVIAVLTAAEWVASFLVALSGWIFIAIAGIAFLTAVLSYLMGLSDGPEALRMLGAAFLFWSLPHIGNALIAMVAAGRAYAEHLLLKQVKADVAGQTVRMARRRDFLCAFAMPGNTFINNEYWRVPGKSRRTA